MTLTADLHTSLCLAGLAIAGLAFVVVFPLKRPVIGGVVAALALWGTAWLYTAGERTVTVRERDGVIVAERSIEVGPPRFEWKDGTRIVNHTSKELTLFKLQYVDLDHPSLGGDFSEEVIAPHTTVTVHHKIHWVGPDHPPPYLVSLKSGDKGRRWWLTW